MNRMENGEPYGKAISILGDGTFIFDVANENKKIEIPYN